MGAEADAHTRASCLPAPALDLRCYDNCFNGLGARYRTTGNADRASFTRLTALRSSGTSLRDAVAMARAHEPDGSGS